MSSIPQNESQSPVDQNALLKLLQDIQNAAQIKQVNEQLRLENIKLKAQLDEYAKGIKPDFNIMVLVGRVTYVSDEFESFEISCADERINFYWKRNHELREADMVLVIANGKDNELSYPNACYVEKLSS